MHAQYRRMIHFQRFLVSGCLTPGYGIHECEGSVMFTNTRMFFPCGLSRKGTQERGRLIIFEKKKSCSIDLFVKPEFNYSKHFHLEIYLAFSVNK